VLTPAQFDAVTALVAHLDELDHANDSAVGSLVGPAGSGKTVIMRHVVTQRGGEDAVLDAGDLPEPVGNEDGLNPGLLLVAPTNRAARQLRRVTGCAVSTIHRAIYQSRPVQTKAGERLARALEALGEAVKRLAAAGDARPPVRRRRRRPP
jgi:hypothetical protein